MIKTLLGVGWKMHEIRQITTAELIFTFRSIVGLQVETELNYYRASSYAQATEKDVRQEYYDSMRKIKDG
jgi:hypothetical protein